MRGGTERILTTHVGSLPRPAELLDALDDADAEFSKLLPDAVRSIVRQQRELGIDLVNDGEYPKPSFVTYVGDRLAGFESSGATADAGGWISTREGRAFPVYYGQLPAPAFPDVVCTEPIRYIGREALDRDIGNLKAALHESGVTEAFMTSISPVEIVFTQRNEYYPSEEDYLFAVADALREEYAAIIESGLVLQVDDPCLVTYYNQAPDLTIEEVRRWALTRVEAINHALRGLPEERIRFHTCYSINAGPRVHDMNLEDMVDIMLRVQASAYSFEAGNSRHEHEWRIWESVRLPEGKTIIPGVITNSSVMVEHPRVIADRIVRFARVVGRENVIAGSDCGFASFARSKEFDEGVVWAKLAALAEGARLATEELWRTSAAA